MKAITAAIGGFLLSAGLFGAGLAFAMIFLVVKPSESKPVLQNVASSWPDASATDIVVKRVQRPAAEAPVQLASATVSDTSETSAPRSDTTLNDALSAPQMDPAAEQSRLAHVQWCRARYRSYDETNDNYRSFSGSVKPCVSPYSGATAAAPSGARTVVADSAESVQAMPAVQYVADNDAPNCTHYRTYDPIDQTYQPYGGGPRQACR